MLISPCIVFVGFKSRVRFPSVLDPAQVCSYISEVLDAGLLGPLFKVRSCHKFCTQIRIFNYLFLS